MYSLFLTVFTTIIVWTDAQNIHLESALIKCNLGEGGHGDHLKHELGAHDADSPLPEQLHNDFHLKLRKSCSRKLQVSLKITVPTKAQSFVSDALVIVDKIHEEESNRISQLLYPLAIKVHQSTTFQVYPFKYLYKVNGKAYEEVINRDNDNDFMGCHSDPLASSNSVPPTCGVQTDAAGTHIQTGFCCGCKGPGENFQFRGGQKCNAKELPEHILTSAHCLRFSTFWYGVFEIQPPELLHQVQIQLFRSSETTNGTLSWRKVSETETAKTVSPTNPKYEGKDISFTYREGSGIIPMDSEHINASQCRLLIPLPNPEQNQIEQADIPLAIQGTIVDSLLIVPKSMLAPQGAHCDRVGVSFPAFLNQDHACNQHRNSCLSNQPFDLWAEDDPKKGARRRKFKLSSFGPVHETMPIKLISDQEGMILIDYQRQKPSFIDIEIPADDLELLSVGSGGSINYVITDMSPDGVKIVAEIANTGVLEASFSVQVVKCSNKDMAHSLKGQPKKISPYMTEQFSIDVHFQSNVKNERTFTCLMVLVNGYSEVVAVRKISFSPTDTCICQGTTVCTCTTITLNAATLPMENVLEAGMARPSDPVGRSMIVIGSSSGWTMSTNPYLLCLCVLILSTFVMSGPIK